MPPNAILMCVTAGSVGQPSEPIRITMYVPIKAVKNMISVPRNSHIPSLAFEIGIPILRVGAAIAWFISVSFARSPSVFVRDRGLR